MSKEALDNVYTNFTKSLNSSATHPPLVRMAYSRKSGNNALAAALLAEFTGGMGAVSIRQHKNKIILTRDKVAPKRKKIPTPATKAKRSLFQEAVSYARKVIKDPKRKAAYAKNLKGKRNAYQAALSAYIQLGGKVVI